MLVSCHKEADYTIQIGETCSLCLFEDPSTDYVWEWENQDQSDVVMMYRDRIEAHLPPDTNGLTYLCTNFNFKGLRKGQALVKLAYAKEAPKELQRRLFFTIRVEK
ncbi:MAG: protease inhibitor I42 family protein [Bacteroidales bacterium]|nr:protease inhibitor I42 family protein [Bacteroidales bacterium]